MNNKPFESTLIESNKDYNYFLYNFKYIVDNKQKFIEHSNVGFQRFLYRFPNQSSTFSYGNYNIITLCGGSIYYWTLFKELCGIIRHYSNHNKPLWFQSWLNFHKNNEVLNWHLHSESKFHGYISIDPKKTITEFEHFKIKNETGNIYIGPSYLFHKVVVLEKFDDSRITLGFDVLDEEAFEMVYDHHGEYGANVGMIPVL